MLAGLDLAELDDPIEPYLTCLRQLELEYPFVSPPDSTVARHSLDALAFADATNTPATFARTIGACLDRFGTHAYSFYHNDPRYLTVWLTYLRRCVPLDTHGHIYIYLYSHGIGVALARFYESYAEWLLREPDGESGARARRVLEIGVQRGARPVQRLEKMYRQVVATTNNDHYHPHNYDNVLPRGIAKREHIAVALLHLRDEVNHEDYCLEEVLARSRDILYKSYHRPGPTGFSTVINDHGVISTTVVATPRGRKPPKKSSRLSSSSSSSSSVVATPARAASTPTRDERVATAAPAVVIYDAVCDPTAGDHKRAILAARRELLAGSPRVHDASTTTRLEEQQALRRAFKRANGHGHTHGFLLSLPNSSNSNGLRATTNIQFMVRKFLGEGGFGAVYLAEPLTPQGHATGRAVALKVEEEPNAWEPYILTLLQQRLTGAAHRHALEQYVVHLYGAYLFRDASCLALEYLPQGTVLDAVNAARRVSGTALLDEVVVVFFVAQLLRAVEALHAARVIHGDIKPDNVMLQLDPVDEDAGQVWDRHYRAPSDNGGNGAPGWQQKRLKLIDFGRAIDLAAYRPGVVFSAAGWAGKMDQQDCVEMREGRTWTYQADYHGVAGVVHCLLFGRFIQTTVRKAADGSGAMHYTITAPYKRYWQQHLWADLFHTLLNSASVAAARGSDAREDGMPITNELARLRMTFERWLEANCEAGTNSLKTALRKLELALTPASAVHPARKR
ncbi:hypothetical protein D0Z00_002337 [Geotrichum galactomycetum]|uniref:Uncharacterized protein n=1 Tax=Geotrichum galactomycetum TaxID=27317 RepID=A0ACB6V4F8_9ASCO|nr:hypothetical protein D0Z00_002337 [Geotrichum candidum]